VRALYRGQKPLSKRANAATDPEFSSGFEFSIAGRK